jgi:hypothetical protein
MPRNDPQETGGMFIGRRPGTAPIRFRTAPGEGTTLRRRRFDEALAGTILAVEVTLAVSLWLPQPLGWLWVGSHVYYQAGSISFGILTAFAGMMTTLLISLSILKRLDYVWRLVRRSAGHDQREGILERVFVVSAAISVVALIVYILFIAGPTSNLFPERPS